MAELPREARLDELHFYRAYLTPQRPVLITDEVPHWPAFRRWTWPYLLERLGDQQVDIFDDFFAPTATSSFAEFVASTMNTGTQTSRQRYVRWFARNHHADGNWADAAFAALRDDWRHPPFLPTTDYVVPRVAPPERAEANRSAFPYRALLVSAAGARTRLHLDPWTTAAVLCQISGEKHVQLWSPQEHDVMLQLAGKPDRDAALAGVPPTYEGTLAAGEIVFIPAGWWHQVDTTADSVSLTWNFIHRTAANSLVEHVQAHSDDPELHVAQYFFGVDSPAALNAALQDYYSG